MSTVRWEKEENVAWLLMDSGKNLHNPLFVKHMLAALDEIESDRTVKAVILTSTDSKNFSQGIDLEWFGPCFEDPGKHEEIRTFLRGLNRVFSRFLTYPIPVIAAINGHAFGDGAILSCACDFRLMRKDRGFFCFPEVDVKIPFLPGMLAVVEKAVPETFLNDIYLTGRRVGAEELLKHGVVVKASPDLDSLKKDCFEFASSFDKGREVFKEIKRRKHGHILQVFENDDEAVIRSLDIVMV